MSDFKGRVTKTFDDWASWYDEQFGGWMRYSTNMVLNEIKIPDSPTCLDVACGTGISTFELMKACYYRGKFVGIDISTNMIDIAKKIASERRLENVDFKVGDVDHIEYPDATFDLVLCNMSLHFFPDKRRTVAEICRVLKPGGQYAFTYAGKPAWRECMEIVYRVAARHPELLKFHRAVADTENMVVGLEESIDLFEGAGLKISNIYERRGINYTDPSFLVSDSNSCWYYWKQVIPENMLDSIRSELVEAGREAMSPRGFKYTSFVIFAWGTKS